jgi:hypothetical protein
MWPLLRWRSRSIRRSARVEARHRHPPAAVELADQQLGDQEAGDHEDTSTPT